MSDDGALADDTTGAGAGAEGGRARARKAPAAFRTISEVADELHIPQHVLRFWETRFPQVKPLKRGGGRRYYRPDDITLLRSIAHLLYVQGYTIKGVQRLLREGSGTLPDDIPPASETERHESGLDREEGEPLASDADDLLALAAVPPSTSRADTVPPPNRPENPSAPDPAGRAALGDVLADLEALRRLLD